MEWSKPDSNQIIRDLHNFHQVRMAFRPGNKGTLTTIKKVVNEATKICSAAFVGVQGMLSKWKGKRVNNKLTEETEFITACEIVITKLEEINEVYDGMLQPKLQSMKLQLENKEVLISFYGESNVGKSTILNSIMKNWYLPVKKEVTTAVSVYIQFKEPRFLTDTAVDDEDDQMEDILCGWKCPMDVKAKGSENIKKKLEEYNEEIRSSDYDVKSRRYSLILKTPFGRSSNENPKFVMLDNPGYDEFGSSAITQSVKESEILSSACIVVTSFANYRNNELSETLSTITSKHPEIIGQNRLTIIVNKMDEALAPDYGEPIYKKEEVVSQIKNFLCKKVFQCPQEKMPSNLIILMCGTWALYARAYKETQNEGLERQINKEMEKLRSIQEFSDHEKLKNSREYPFDEKAKILEEYSHILQLESRLAMMAESSMVIWKQKMVSDISDCLDLVKTSLTSEIEKVDQLIEKTSKKVISYHDVIIQLKDLYSEVHANELKLKENKLLPTDLAIWKKFEDACHRDIKLQREEKIKMDLKKCVEEALEHFKYSTSEKISRKRHSAEELEQYLYDLLIELSRKMSQLLNEREIFNNLSEVFLRETMGIHTKTLNLGTKLIRVLNLKDGEESIEKGTYTPGLPKLNGPVFTITLNIPKQLSAFEEFLKFFRTLFNLPATKDSYKFEASHAWDDCDRPLTEKNSSDSQKKKQQNGLAGFESATTTDNEESITLNDYSGNTSDYYVLQSRRRIKSTTLSQMVTQFDSESGYEDNDGFSDKVCSKTGPSFTQDLVDLFDRKLTEVDSRQHCGATFSNSFRNEGTVDTSAVLEQELTDVSGENIQEDLQSHLQGSSTNSVDHGAMKMTAECASEIRQLDRVTSIDDVHVAVLTTKAENGKEKANSDEEKGSNCGATSGDQTVKDEDSNSGQAPESRTTSPLHTEDKSSFIFTRWSSALDQVKSQMKSELEKHIDSFFEDLNRNVILQFCQSHNTAAIGIIKDFDESNTENLDLCKAVLEGWLKGIKQEKRHLEVLIKQYEEIVNIQKNFKYRIFD